jgi:hypothetical protein
MNHQHHQLNKTAQQPGIINKILKIETSDLHPEKIEGPVKSFGYELTD